MSAVTVPRSLAVAAVLVATAAVLLTRGGLPDDAPLAAPDAADATLTPFATSASDAPRADASETPAAAKLRDLNALSETYRNTTFLISIRDAGFVCNELRNVYGGVNDSMTWTATCSDLLAYTVRIASAGTLHVEPMLEHADSLGPTLPTRDFGDDPVRVPPPQELRPQQR
jgi:hypothetical protein